MSDNIFHANDFKDFLDKSPTCFHAASNIAGMLERNGFGRLNEKEHWKLVPSGKYYVERNGSSIIAFTMPCAATIPTSARIVTSHLDSPLLKLKLNGARLQNGCLIIPTEPYGGLIGQTWFDRPLSIAGRLCYRSPQGTVSTLINCEKCAVIPNLAIHLNRNDKEQPNPQQHFNAIITTGDTANALANKISEIAGIEVTSLLNECVNIADSELYLCDSTPAAILNEKLINSSRLDNLSSAFPALLAICDAHQSNTLNVSFFADHEEIGSGTPYGAASAFLPDILMRIFLATGGNQEDYYVAMANSYLVSADAAHAIHPNYPEKHDDNYAPTMGAGIVLKMNASWRYCTTGSSAAAMREYADCAGIKMQSFTNRADMGCGSTVGPTTAARLGIVGADIGVAMLAMHSIRETAALSDVQDMVSLLLTFFTKA